MHNMGRQVHINIMGSLHTGYQLACNIDSLCVLILYCRFNLGQLYAGLNSCYNILGNDWVFRERILMRAYEVLVNLNNLKLVACLYQKDELFLRHDLAVLAVSLCAFFYLVIVWKFHACKILRRRIADIYLVWPVVHTFLIGTQMAL